jgi:hypothetical protein
MKPNETTVPHERSVVDQEGEGRVGILYVFQRPPVSENKGTLSKPKSQEIRRMNGSLLQESPKPSLVHTQDRDSRIATTYPTT